MEEGKTKQLLEKKVMKLKKNIKKILEKDSLYNRKLLNKRRKYIEKVIYMKFISEKSKIDTTSRDAYEQIKDNGKTTHLRHEKGREKTSNL